MWGCSTSSAAGWTASGSMLCVGLDPDPRRLPAAVGGDDAVFAFCRAIVDATADLVCAFKPQFAHFAAQRAEPALERLCTYIRSTYPDVLVLLDAKRGDIGSTAEHYATEAFVRYGAHAVTVNPYLGFDAVEPYLRHDGGGIFVLCRTSNPGSGDLQDLDVGGRPLYQHVAALVAEKWSQHGECGLVVGADLARRVDCGPRISSATCRSCCRASAHRAATSLRRSPPGRRPTASAWR